MAKTYSPPFKISPTMLGLVAEISELLGRWSVLVNRTLSPKLRRGNRIQTIQASLAIENNTLSLEQVTAVLEGKRVLGLPREIQEVRNAFTTYENMEKWEPDSLEDLLAAHKLLMKSLVDIPGQLRTRGVGIYREKTLIHMAPQANRVHELIQNLLNWLRTSDIHPLIKSCIFHYEFEFIHPFEDGNGRMGRLWQTLILSKWQSMLAFLPVETVIWQQQEDYYQALADSDKSSDAGPFIEFMLQALYTAMKSVVFDEKSSSPKSSSKSSPKTENKLLDLIRKNSHISSEQLGQALGISKRAVLKQISKLKTEGKLKRIGPAKGGHWQIMRRKSHGH